jgi:hypothetical protein
VPRGLRPRRFETGRRVRDFIEIKDYSSLDGLIETLASVRRALPGDAEPAVAMKGDDNFGRFLSIAYWRPQTQDEAEIDARYAAASRPGRGSEVQPVHQRPPRLRSVG